MSKFLAPIHTWLFNKVILKQELQKEIIKKHREVFKDSVNEIEDEGRLSFGNYINNKPLEELIDQSNIHGWLQNQIKIAESREAFIVTSLKKRFGFESEEITKACYIQQGKDCADMGNIDTLPSDVFTSLNNFILCGMPCDRVNVVESRDENQLIYFEKINIHKENYELGRGNLDYLDTLNNLWIESFITNLKGGYKVSIYKKDNIKYVRIYRKDYE